MPCFLFGGRLGGLYGRKRILQVGHVVLTVGALVAGFAPNAAVIVFARGISRMIDDEKYCIDILTQISAVTSALETVALGLLDDHLRQCVGEAAGTGGPDVEAKIAEASQAIARLVRS